MSKQSLDHLTLSERQTDAQRLAALAATLADTLVDDRCVHPDDADKPDLGAVATILAERLQAHAGALSELIDYERVVRAHQSGLRAGGVQ